MSKSAEEIIGDIVAQITATIGTVDTRTDTVLMEAILSPVANQLEGAYAESDVVLANQSIASPEGISTSAMAALAANFGVIPSAGSPASGVVRFSRYVTPPTPIPIPVGSIVSSVTSSDELSFNTLVSASLSASSNVDPVSGDYYVDVAVIATSTGSAGNVAAGSITSFSIAGIDSVTNLNAFSGGEDAQTNTQVASIIEARATGNMGTKGGYISLVQSNFVVDDVAVVGPLDPDAVRTNPGAVDIIIQSTLFVENIDVIPASVTTYTPIFLPLTAFQPLVITGTGTSLQEITDTFTVSGNSITLSQVPLTFPVPTAYDNTAVAALTYTAGTPGAGQFMVNYVSGVVSFDTGGSAEGHSVSVTYAPVSDTTPSTYTLVPGIDYIVSIDNSSSVARSYEELSTIRFDVTSFTPSSGSFFTINYPNNQIIRIIQSFLEDPANLIVGADPLVKSAIEVGVTVIANIHTYPSYVPSTVQAAVRSALAAFSDGLLLGVSVAPSQISDVIGSVPGVDYIDLPTFQVIDSRTALPSNNIAIGTNEYASIISMTITPV